MSRKTSVHVDISLNEATVSFGVQTGGLLVAMGSLAACVPAGSCEPEIVATDEQRAVLEDTYAAMAAQVVLPLCARRIEVVPEIALDDRHPKGRFDPGGFRIELASQPLASLRSTLRHELCHALSHQHRLSPDLPPSGDLHLEEAFARLCEAGPVAADVLLRSSVLADDETAQLELVAGVLWTMPPAPTALPEAVVEPVVWPVAPGLLQPRPLAAFGDPRLEVQAGWPLLLGTSEAGQLPDAHALDPQTGDLGLYPDSPWLPVDTLEWPSPEIGIDDLDPSIASSGFEWSDLRLADFHLPLPSGRTLRGHLIQEEGLAPTWLPMRTEPTVPQQLAIRYDDAVFQVAHDEERSQVAVSAWIIP